MIELIDTLPDTNVQPAEYKRLLGFPRDYVWTGKARELAEWARGWYAKNGRPWVYARQAESLQVTNGSMVIDGVTFTSDELQRLLVSAKADGAILVAVSAGPELEAESMRLWKEEKPDEYFFLEIFGSAIVEHLVTMTGARLCAWAEARHLAVLPHYSPGYTGWDVAQQTRLLQLLRKTKQHELPAYLESMDSGMLRPKKSLLAVFGLTTHLEGVRKITDLVACENCSYSACQFRRVPYRRTAELAQSELVSQATQETAEETVTAQSTPSLDTAAKYSVNPKALKRWADERLKLTFNDDGTIDAAFRYEGTTCTNMGRAILFDYAVKLSSRSEGYVIREAHCGPAPGDTGHTYMCRYMNNAEHLMVAIDQEKPLLNQPLNDVITWQRQTSSAGCYCEPSARKHKWGLVLETIHWALVQQEQKAMTPQGVGR